MLPPAGELPAKVDASADALSASASADARGRRRVSSFAPLFCGRFRFFVLILGTMCLSSIFSNMITINFTIICMDPEAEAHGARLSTVNASEIAHAVVEDASPQNPKHSYTQYQKTALQWSVSVASGVATFPFSFLCTRYGARAAFLASGVMSAAFTALIPLAVEYGFTAFIVIRLFQGLAYACDFAVVGVLCTRWASLRENAIFLAVLTCFTPLSSFMTNSVSGVICESRSLGWPYVYYFHALAGLLLFAGWAIFYTDDPQTNRFVTADELALIHDGKTASHINHEPFVPYTAICKTPVVWAVWLNAFVDLSCGLFIIIYAPTYIKKVLNYGIAETGVLGGLIILAKLPVKLICGLSSDTFHCLPERYKMCIFNTVAVCVPGTVYVALCYVPQHLPLVAVAMFALCEAATGANCGGFYKCGALVSRQYAEFVIACTQFIKCVVFFVAPALVAIFVHDETDGDQWHSIFLIIAASLFLANVMFCVYATDRPCEFTKITQESAAKEAANGYSSKNGATPPTTTTVAGYNTVDVKETVIP